MSRAGSRQQAEGSRDSYSAIEKKVDQIMDTLGDALANLIA